MGLCRENSLDSQSDEEMDGCFDFTRTGGCISE